MKIFKHSKLDILLVVYAMIGFISPIAIGHYINNAWLWLLLTPIQVIFLVVVMNTSMHHHTHVPLFANRRLNRAYEIFVSMTTAIPFQLWKYYHLIHHRYNNDVPKNNIVKDPLSFYRYGTNGNRENFWSYIVYGLYRDITKISVEDVENTCSTKFNLTHTDKLRTEQIAILCFMIIISVVNFWYFVYYVLVITLSLIANNANSYGEHYEAVDHANFRCDSVGSYGKWYNLLCFNSGYHQEHHVKPGLHWTKLPEITDTLPKHRKTIDGMFMFNAPIVADLKEIIRKT